MLSCDETEELLPEYALGALSAGEATGVAHHLHTCPRHTASLDQYEAVCAGLFASVPLVNPPPKLKAQLLAKVASPARAPHRAELRTRLAWAVAAFAAVLAIVFGIWGASLQRRIDDQATQRQELLAISARADARMALLETTEAGSLAKGVIIYGDTMAAIWTVGLPTLESDQVYQCWWIDSSNHLVRGGSFRPESAVGTWVIPMPPNAQTGHSLSITIESTGQDVEPKGPQVMRADL